MRSLKATTGLTLLVLAYVSCSKTVVPISPLASLNIFNATVNQEAVKVNFTSSGSKTGTQYYNAILTSIGYGSNNLYQVSANTTVPITVVTAADTNQTVFASSLRLANGGIYSLFLAGRSGSVDTMMVRDILTTYTDSSMGVRFVNLSPDSPPINVTLAATPAVNEFAGLGYRQISSFKKYPAGSANGSYTFNVYNASNNSLLATYTLKTPYFHNVTLVFDGLAAGSPANGVSRVNNY